MTNPKADQFRAAAVNGNLKQLQILLTSTGQDVVFAEDDPEELTSLHLAAAAGHADVVKFLLSESVGTDVNVTRINNFTPLHAAAMKGQTAICKQLLVAGGNPNV